MGFLRTSSGARRGLRALRDRGRRAQLQERRVRGSGLFVSAPSGRVTLGAAVQSVHRPLTRPRCPEGTLPPTSGSVSLSSCPQPTRVPVSGAASPTRYRPPPRLSSLLVRLPNRKSERATRAPRAHARGQLPRLLHRRAKAGASGWPSWARFRGSTYDHFPAPRPLFPHHLSRRVDSGQTARPRGLCACRRGSIRPRVCLQGLWRR